MEKQSMGCKKDESADKSFSGGKKTRKVLKAISSGALVLLFLFIGAVVFLSIQSKAAGKIPSIGGYQIYSVLGGSMEPGIHKGSVVFLKRPDFNDLKIGDVITFISVADKKTIVTHRIVEIKRGEELSFITRGDANDANDTDALPAEHIIGQVKITVPFIGYLMNFARTKVGLISLIIIPGVLIILFELLSLRKEIIHVKKQKREKLLAQMKESLIKESAQGGNKVT